MSGSPKAKGKHLGRVAKLTKTPVKELRKPVAAGEDRAQVAEAFGFTVKHLQLHGVITTRR